MTLNNLADPPNLTDLPRLGRGIVVGVEGEDSTAQRLKELGFTPGTLVEFVRVAPLGDPLCFRLRGTDLCLRHREAARVTLERQGLTP